MIKLVALDLDDTLLDSQLKIEPETADAIRDALLQGVVVTLATGRMYKSALPFALDLGLDVPLITYHGALIKTSLSKQVLYHRSVPLEDARLVLEHILSRGHHVNLYMEDELYTQADGKYTEEYARLAKVPFKVVPRLMEVLTVSPDKLMVIDDEQVLDGLAKELRALVGERLHITKSKASFLEITHPEGNKGLALHTLAGELGITRDEVMAVGDSLNDLEMIEYAGVGVAMGNARPEVKSKAQFVTLSNDDNGVAEALRRFVLRT